MCKARFYCKFQWPIFIWQSYSNNKETCNFQFFTSFKQCQKKMFLTRNHLPSAPPGPPPTAPPPHRPTALTKEGAALVILLTSVYHFPTIAWRITIKKCSFKCKRDLSLHLFVHLFAYLFDHLFAYLSAQCPPISTNAWTIIDIHVSYLPSVSQVPWVKDHLRVEFNFFDDLPTTLCNFISMGVQKLLKICFRFKHRP